MTIPMHITRYKMLSEKVLQLKIARKKKKQKSKISGKKVVQTEKKIQVKI